MENKEKPLSSKEFGGDERWGEVIADKQAFWKEDVKQAVERLKELVAMWRSNEKIAFSRDFEEGIDKIFGEFK